MKHNILYFGNNIDVRLIPKNCSTTLKVLWSQINGLETYLPSDNNPHIIFPNAKAERSNRERNIKKNNDRLFRDNSIRVAIKRDPVDRWLSVLNFCYEMQKFVRNKRLTSNKKLYPEYAKYENLPFLNIGINHAVRYHQEHKSLCDESISQYESADNIKVYTHVFYQRDFNKFIELLEDNIKKNVNRNVFGTKSKSKKWTIKDLTPKSISIIQEEIYKEDYSYGWF